MQRLTARIIIFGLFATMITLSQRAEAQDPEPEYVPEDLEVTEEIELGWDYLLRIGVNGSLGTSSSVIGNTDGNTWTVGVSLDSAANYLVAPHEWRNSFGLGEQFTRTPLVDEFVKSGDIAELESLYMYHVPSVPWFGPFGRFRLATSLFAGSDVQAIESTYSIARASGPETVIDDRLALTDPFLPLALKESAGAFVRPETDPEIQFEVLLGFGARETFAEDQLAVSDSDDTPEIEVLVLEDVIQAGGEFVAHVWGEISDGEAAYEAGVEVMVPFINDLDESDDRGAFDLTNIDIFAGGSLRIVEWASLEYQFRAIREPQLLDEFQIQNLLLLSIGYTFIESQEPTE